MTTIFNPPPSARQHCRHYHYDRGTNFLDGGPRCGVEVDLSAPGATMSCMPPREDGQPRPQCGQREEWSDEERGAWEAYHKESIGRLIAAIGVLPCPIPMRTGGNVACPSCEGGEIRYDRWYRGASFTCSTPHCCGAHFSIKEPTDWPAGKAGAA